MRRALLLYAMLLLLTTTGTAASSPPQRQRTIRYPRVYGVTGHLYGPTQAHYQYQRQYGHPWQGTGGLTAPVHGRHIHTPQHSYYFSPSLYPSQVYGNPYSYYGYSSYYNSNPYFYNPLLAYPNPITPYIPGYTYNSNLDPYYNRVLRQALLENRRRWKQPLHIQPLTNYKPRRRPKKTTSKAKIASIRAIASGDQNFRRQEYAKALGRYRKAVRVAPDNAQARFRLGLVLATAGKYTEAVKEIKIGLKLDISWPVTGQSLGRLFGRRNKIAKSNLLGNTTRWAGEDIRDPDRLFLLGVLLYFDSETDKAETVFEAAYRLAGKGDHLIAFLRPVDPDKANSHKQKTQKQPAPPKPKTIDELIPLLVPPLPEKVRPQKNPNDKNLKLPDNA